MGEEKAKANQREAGMMSAAGVQGVGKTYQNMYVIYNYVQDKFFNKVKGRKALILDVNGEYTKEEFKKNDIDNFDPKRIALKDIPEWSKANIIECRRIDAKSLSISEKKKVLEYLLSPGVFRSGLLVLEDLNNFILSVTFMEEIVGGLINLRHRAVDVLVSYQALRPIEPRIIQNSRWCRLHYQSDRVESVKGKINNMSLWKIAQLIVNRRYFNNDKRFFVYIHNFTNKIEGKFTKQEFMEACERYLAINKGEVKEYMEANSVTKEEAVKAQAKLYFNQYYGNH